MKAMEYRFISGWFGWAASRIGRPGQTGLILMAVALLICTLVVKPMQTELGTLRDRVGYLTKLPPQPAQAPIEHAWRTQLPTSHAGYAYLARIFAAAETAGINLEEGLYREAKDQETGLTRLAISLPVRGKYPAIRAFLAHALAKEPGLALEGARLTRDSIDENEIQGELRFVLFLGAKT